MDETKNSDGVDGVDADGRGEELELIAGQDNPDLDPGEVDVDG